VIAVEEYVDARELLSDHEQHICPDCGVVRWFKRHQTDYDRDPWWSCQQCGERLYHTLEYPCPKCDVRLQFESGAFVCRNQTCDVDSIDVDRDELIDRLSGDSHMVQGMPGVLMGECPLCGAKSVNGTPDGDVACDNCSDFYGGQYLTEWYCYAVWVNNPEQIRVNE